MTKQDLDRSEVARGLVDDGGFGPAQRVSAIFLRCQTNGPDPLVDETRVLTRAQVTVWMDPARKREVIDRAASSPKLGQQASSCV
jgi:hypothetical protein